MLEQYQIILASQSPRRKELLQGLGLQFQTYVMPDLDESYPASISKAEVASYIALKKAKAYQSKIKTNELIITADTVVIIHEQIIGKPANRNEAVRMLELLSGQWHEVITGVVISTLEKQISFSVSSKVEFSALENDEIYHYVDTFQPFDKAGGYGIQEWIGYIGIKNIRGSFYNVMGLPVQRLYQELKNF